MIKVHQMLSVDDEIVKKAKQMGLNLSAEFERAMKLRLAVNKKDLPEGCLKIKCSQCGKVVEECYYCRERQRVYCGACQAKFDMDTCPHDLNGEHEHVLVPGYGFQHEALIPQCAELSKNGI